MAFCKKCGALIEEGEQICHACHEKTLQAKERMEEKKKSLPNKYEIAFKEAELGVKWADFLAYGICLPELVILALVFIYDIFSYHEFFICCKSVIGCAMATWAMHEIVYRRKKVIKAVRAFYASNIILDFLTICYFPNLDYDVVVPFFVLRIIFFGICLWKNDSYFNKRKDIFVFDVPN